MPDYVPIQDLTIVGSVGDNDLFPMSDGSGAYAVKGSTIKSYAASDAAAAAADAAASKTAAQNAATASGNSATAAGNAQSAAEAAQSAAEAAVAEASTGISNLSGKIGEPFTVYQGSFSSGSWISSYYSTIFPVNPGAKVKMTTGSKTTPYIGLRSATLPPSVGDSADYSTEPGWDGNRVQDANATREFTIPSDVHYLYLYAGTNSSYDRFPLHLLVDGFDYFAPLFEGIIGLSEVTVQQDTINFVESKLYAHPYGIEPFQMSLFVPSANIFSDFCYHLNRRYYRYRLDTTVPLPRISETANYQGWLIKVKPETTYTLGPLDFKLEILTADFDLDFQVTSISGSTSNTITTGKNSCWLCLTQRMSRDMSDWMMVEGTEYPTNYVSGYPQWLAEPLPPGGSATPKTVAFMGDSITAGVATTKCFHEYLHDRYGWICLNYGFGGSGYYRNSSSTDSGKIGMGVPGIGENTTPSNFFTPNNIVARLAELNATEINGIVIFAGTNDYGNNVSIEDYQSAIEQAFEYCKTYLTAIPVLAMTPIHRRYGANANTQGKTLRDYANVLIEECVKYGVAYVDTMTMSGLYPDNEANRLYYFSNNPDSGLHPSIEGHKAIASTVGERLKELMSYQGFN